jgi:hypothetical protein
MAESRALYGLIARFDGAHTLRAAAQQLRQAGYRELEAYTPFPVDGLAEDLGAGRERLPLWALIGGLAGALISYLLEYYAAVYAYPLNIGGRPLHSWPAFIPLSIEFTILGAALALVLGLLFGSSLPKLRHPLFAVSGFESVTRDGFFLCVAARDPGFEFTETGERLRSAGALEVFEVPA